ncbi:MAG TPA: CoA-binding protein [Herpetosiphonaceae bacterium]
MAEVNLKELLAGAKTVAVVGLSDKPDRDSYRVAEYLQRAGYAIIPVNPVVDEVLGVKAVGSLREIEGPIDIVDIFRRSDQVGPIVEEAIEVGAKAVWMQLGVVNEEAAARAREAGLPVVMDRCIKIEHSLLG